MGLIDFIGYDTHFQFPATFYGNTDCGNLFCTANDGPNLDEPEAHLLLSNG